MILMDGIVDLEKIYILCSKPEIWWLRKFFAKLAASSRSINEQKMQEINRESFPTHTTYAIIFEKWQRFHKSWSQNGTFFLFKRPLIEVLDFHFEFLEKLF